MKGQQEVVLSGGFKIIVKRQGMLFFACVVTKRVVVVELIRRRCHLKQVAIKVIWRKPHRTPFTVHESVGTSSHVLTGDRNCRLEHGTLDEQLASAGKATCPKVGKQTKCPKRNKCHPDIMSPDQMPLSTANRRKMPSPSRQHCALRLIKGMLVLYS